MMPRPSRRAAVGAVAGVAVAAGAVAFLLRCGDAGCPSAAALRSYTPPEASRVYARDSTLLASLAPERRVVVSLDAISPLLREGFVAVEDRRFREHGGIDLRSVARAAWRNLRSLSIEEGFSTITMQLARNVFPEQLRMEDRFRRKLWEVRLAPVIEDGFSKDRILALYLNQIYLGGGLYGVEAAARGYFGKGADEVDPAQAALLIGLARSPEGYNPRRHPDRAIRRRSTVLSILAREGVITPAAAKRADARPLELAPPPAETRSPAPYLVARVRAELAERFGPDADVRGLRVRTGLDPGMQAAAREALREGIRRVESGAYGPYGHPAPGSGAGASSRSGGPDAPDASPFLQGMVVALDARSGAVRALVGGRDFRASQFDRAFRARRQPGSAFKPVVYAAALSLGAAPTHRVSTDPVSVEAEGREPWRPAGTSTAAGETVTLASALAVSDNQAAVRVGRWAGERQVAETARRLGLTTPVPRLPSIHLGAAEVMPAELVAAYATLTNGGVGVEPRVITGVEDASGRVLWEPDPPGERVIPAGVAFLIRRMLQGVVDRGTGVGVRAAGYRGPAAGKTGTTDAGRDLWFVGASPEVAAGVWLGFDRPRAVVPGGSGGRIAAPIWGRFMAAAGESAGGSSPTWPGPPAGIVRLPVDTLSGLRAVGGCPEESVVEGYFLEGSEPRARCPLHPPGAMGSIADGIRSLLDRIF